MRKIILPTTITLRMGASGLLIACGLTFCLAALGPGKNIDRIRFPEPSGIVWHPVRHTLFVVGDEGDIAEMKTDGTLVRRGHLGGEALPAEDPNMPAPAPRRIDLEGITCNPATGLLYAVIEEPQEILEVDPETLKVLRSFEVPHVLAGKTITRPGGQGLEAITFVPDAGHPEGGTFFVANQAFSNNDPEDRSALIQLELPLISKPKEGGKAVLLKHMPMQQIDLSGLQYNADRKCLLVLSDSGNKLMCVSLTGEVKSEEALSGRDQEGVTLDDEGYMYIAQDSGGIIRMKARSSDLKD